MRGTPPSHINDPQTARPNACRNTLVPCRAHVVVTYLMSPVSLTSASGRHIVTVWIVCHAMLDRQTYAAGLAMMGSSQLAVGQRNGHRLSRGDGLPSSMTHNDIQCHAHTAHSTCFPQATHYNVWRCYSQHTSKSTWLNTTGIACALHRHLQGLANLAHCSRSGGSGAAHTPCAPQLVHQPGPVEPHGQPLRRCGRPCNGGPICRRSCACGGRPMLASPGCTSDIPAAHMVLLAQPSCDLAACSLHLGTCVLLQPDCRAWPA